MAVYVSPLLFQRSTDGTAQIVSLIRHYQCSDHRGVLSIGLLPAVICSKIPTSMFGVCDVRCSEVQCGAVRCSVVQRGAMRCSVVQ